MMRNFRYLQFQYKSLNEILMLERLIIQKVENSRRCNSLMEIQSIDTWRMILWISTSIKNNWGRAQTWWFKTMNMIQNTNLISEKSWIIKRIFYLPSTSNKNSLYFVRLQLQSTSWNKTKDNKLRNSLKSKLQRSSITKKQSNKNSLIQITEKRWVYFSMISIMTQDLKEMMSFQTTCE